MSLEELLRTAVEQGDLEALKQGLAVDRKAQLANKMRLLHLAVQMRGIEFIKVLIGVGCKPDEFDKAGETALHYAAERCDLNVIELLLKDSKDVNSKCQQNEKTALHHATIYGVTPVVEFLLQNGANPNAQTKRGETALHFAAMFGKIEVTELLLKHCEVDVTIQTEDGRHALDYARDSMFRNDTLVKILEGIIIDQKTSQKKYIK